jgi:hypothetical protein
MRRGGLWLLLFALLAAAPALACRLAAEGVATPAASPTAFAVATATSAPAEEVPGQILASFDSEELGLSFQYPATWSLDTSDDIPMLVSDERLFEEALGSVDGAVVLFLVDDAANMGEGPLDQLVEEVVADMVTGGVTVDRPRLLTINGQEAATITVESVEDSGVVALSTVMAIRHEGRAVLISAAAPQATAGEYEQALDTVVNSVRLRPAAGPAVAGTLGYGESVRGEVAGLRGSAWRFRGAAGDVIDIEVTPVNEELDVTVDVQDSTGRSILPDGVVDEAFGTETIRRLELPAAGDYLIVLRGFAGSTGGYTLALAAQSGEAATPSGGDLVIGESYRGRLARNAVDSYQLPETGETISLEVIPDAELDVVLDVFAADGSLQASADTGFSGMRERLTVIAAGGTVQVRGFAGDSGDYTLHVEAGAEEGVRIVASNELQPGDSSHSFPFTAPGGAVITAEVVPEDGLDIAIDIWNDDDGNLQETVDLSFGVENASFTVPADGNYTLVVRALEEQPGAYTITLAGPVEVIFELATGDEVSGVFDASAAAEFLIALDPGETVVITLSPDGATDAVLEVSDLDGNLLASADEYFPGGAETLTFSAPQGTGEGTLYFIRASDYNGNAGGRFTLVVERE